MNDFVYLDNSATTELSSGVKQKMCEAMELYGNPSSLHSLGLSAEKVVSEARSSIATALGVRTPKPGQIVFTSCGTEANNMAINGSVYSKSRRGGKIISTDSEHPSVENMLKKLEADKFSVVRIPTVRGVLDMERLERELDESVILVTMMMVNNETGAIYDIKRVFELVRLKSPDAITHCDAVQGFMKVRFTSESIGADLVSISAHKIHGPKGVGALYISRDILKQRKMISYLIGGGQESGLRSGTENVIGIAGFGEAVRECYSSFDKNITHTSALREYAVEKLSNLELRLNIPDGRVAPHIINITLPSIKSESMLHYLSGNGIYISSGSACSSHAKTPSVPLTAFGLTPFEADCSLRISLSEFNVKEDIDRLVSCLDTGIKTLVRIKR